ncbi:thiamine biosynthesis protein ThiF [Clostridium sp. DMHC 10]|uniref:sulfur carrier protein ThiS adenylyltransferase ThiF n=1 Tax=Clostridium sp. DMHC 10 TaxID=747377 RepID=UPI00069DCAAE|nr:sulfur carrier protein ThiS adenylyltransferase ThiF [Clostridium sp. DMHC 10]KOF56749.1 thiamine biosynthesis protein ThiF [Clostridium sp. DMHC 10]
MKICVNEKLKDIPYETMLFSLKNEIKEDADVIVYNGFIMKNDIKLKDGDCIVFIKKGEIPSKDEMEAQLMARHTPEVHNKIKKFSIGIAGLGGLGSNAAVSLARVGVGKLLLVDFDVVEPSNLNRQQYFIKHIGMKKVEALKEVISWCNPFVEVDTLDTFINKNNAVDIFKNVDIIIEAFDNPVSKAVLTNAVLTKMRDKKIICASGMAGYFSSNTIRTKKVNKNFYLVGDMENEAKPGVGLMAPRVSIAANHEANAVLRIIMNEE